MKIMWLLVRLLVVLMAVVLTFQTYDDYRTEPIISNLKAMLNKSVALPSGTLCLPLYLGELNEYNESDISYDRALSAFFQNGTVTKEIVLNYGQSWTNEFRHVVHYYLIGVSKYEYLENIAVQEMDKDSDLFSAKRTLEKKMRELNISTDEVRQKFGNETAAFYSLLVKEDGFDPDQYSNYRKIGVGRTKFVGGEQICYEIHFDLISLNRYDYIALSLSEHSLPNPITVGDARGWIIIDLLGRTHVDSELVGMTDYIYPMNFNCSVQLIVQSATLYQVLPVVNDEVQCSTAETADECQQNCRTQLIQASVRTSIIN